MTDTIETTTNAPSNGQGLIANDPVTAEIQSIAVKAFATAQKADTMGKKARAELVYCLIAAHDAPCHATLKNKEGHTVFDHEFTIADYCDAEATKAACDGSNQAKKAMTDEVALRLSGRSDLTNAERQALQQATKAAFGIAAQLGGDWGVARQSVERTARGNLSVPSYLMIDPPKDDAPESEIARYEREKEQPFIIDGSKGHSFAELSRRVNVKEEREGSSGQGGDKAREMTRLEAAKVLLNGAAGGADWVAYLSTISAAELVAMLSLYGEANGDSAD